MGKGRKASSGGDTRALSYNNGLRLDPNDLLQCARAEATKYYSPSLYITCVFCGDSTERISRARAQARRSTISRTFKAPSEKKMTWTAIRRFVLSLLLLTAVTVATALNDSDNGGSNSGGGSGSTDISTWTTADRSTYRIDCKELSRNTSDVALALHVAAFVEQNHPELDSFVANKVDRRAPERFPQCSKAGYANITYTDVKDPLGTRPIVVQVYLVDQTAPQLINIPPQPQHIPDVVECLNDAYRIASERVPLVYLPHVRAVDDCQTEPAVRYQWTTHLDRCRNQGRLTLHWIADDHCGNTGGLSQTIHFQDVRPPMPNPEVDTYFKEHRLHGRYCFHSISATPLCPVALARRIVRESLMHDTCDTSSDFLRTTIKRVERYLCTGSIRKPQNCQFTADGGAAIAGHEVYSSGTILRIAQRVQDSCGNEYPQDIVIDMRFVDKEATCLHDSHPGTLILDASTLRSDNPALCY